MQGAGQVTGRTIRPGAAARRARRVERWKSAVVALVFICAIGGALWYAAVPEVLKHMQGPRPAETAAAGTDNRSGRIVLELSSERCRELSFNNDTGAIQDVNKGCPTATGGAPAAPGQGTSRRLEAISKAFSR